MRGSWQILITSGVISRAMTTKTILHVDMDAFFASVEERDNPDLKGKIVVVGAGTRGVVSSANYAARKFGIRAAMPVSQAKRLAPEAIFISPNHERYTEVSNAVMDIFDSYTPYVEPLSLDEAFLDVTGAERLLGSGRKIGQDIRAEIFKEEGITCSVGIAPNKFIAKLASSRCKPNGLLEILEDRILDFLHPLPVSEIWGVGPKTNEELLALGLRTVADIANTPRSTLIRALGTSLGESLYELSWGRDFREVEQNEVDKSISAAETFDMDIDDQEELLKEILRMCERSASRMREKKFATRTIGLKVRFADFKTINRSKSLPSPITSTKQIYEVAKELFIALKLDRARIRLVGVSLENLTESTAGFEQLTLGEREKGWREATAAIDAASERFGHGVVRPARLFDGDK
jgi:DNA polymerase IV